MSIGHENVTVRRRHHIVRLVQELPGTVSSHAGRSERQQDLALRTELDHLVALAVSVPVPAVGAFGVGHPDVAIPVHMDAVRKEEHPRTEALDELASVVEFQDDRQVRAGAAVRTASLSNPDGPAVAIDVNRARRSPRPPRRHREMVLDGLIRIG
jgi:hypothetical protein